MKVRERRAQTPEEHQAQWGRRSCQSFRGGFSACRSTAKPTNKEKRSQGLLRKGERARRRREWKEGASS